MSATTTNTVIATVDAVPTVPTTLITTAAILIAAKGKGYAKQVKNKMEKTKNTIVGNTTDCYTLVKELYSHSVMLLQQTLFQTENTTSGEEFSTSVGKLMDCIETLSGSIQQNIASLKKIKQKLAQNNKQYIAQSIEFAAIPVDESETTQPPAAKKPRAKKVKEPVATASDSAADATDAAVAAPVAKKPRAKKVKEPVVAADSAETPVAETTPATDAAVAAPAPKKPRAKKVKEPVVAADTTETAPSTDAAAAAPAPKKPRAKKVKEPSATEPATHATAAAAETPVTATEAEVAEAVAQAVIEAVEQAVAEAAAKKKPRAKKTKKSSETVATEDATTVTSESEQPQTETIYTVIHPEVTEDSTAPKKTKKTKEPKKTNKSNQTTEPPSTPIHDNADSITPCAPVKENTTAESIIQNDFVPNHLTFDYEITSEDICRDIELIIDELEEDMISEITAIGK
jgi:hypothetical protein